MSRRNTKRRQTAGDVIDKFLDKMTGVLPEMHLIDFSKGYPRRYAAAGPLTRHDERVKRFNETGNTDHIYINELDKAAFHHDQAYNQPDLNKRREADRRLIDESQRIYKDKSMGKSQRLNAFLVNKFFRIKRKIFGKGIKQSEIHDMMRSITILNNFLNQYAEFVGDVEAGRLTKAQMTRRLNKFIGIFESLKHTDELNIFKRMPIQ